ncbi:hypothetical protein [Rufibacter quisquiliarum]|uniref:DUF6311 domain-containing protein n=1 Tax=Rufibacter quisquiliarum TaxID=1549639 RepID=A0A839GV85_9BACT|nr:hypothetical protein [Rufibacter quisquiliarum]MBA9077691.1 hypothetical protein [Rufibacter quisquiliarum]
MKDIAVHMRETDRNRKYAWVSAGATLLALVAVVGVDVFLSPGKYLFEVIGDHIKNYYVVAYYVKYNSNLWFTGMNYPFGDIALFSDNQPFFSVPLAWIHRSVWPIAPYVTAGQNLFLFFSVAIGAWCMQRILVRLLLPGWYTVLAAVVILLMSPQNTQFDFQYALTYSFALLLPWLLLIKYLENGGSWKWWVGYVLVSLAMGFIHVYHLALNGMFGAAVALVYALQEKQAKVSAKLLAGAVLPSALFLLFISLLDATPDRPQHPFGFFVHRANLEGIFYPYRLFYLPALQKIFPGLQDSRQVSYAYAGLAGTLCVLFFLFKGTRYLLKGRIRLIFRPVFPAVLRYSVWPAVGLLLFGMAIPLKYGFQAWVEQTPMLEQFRVLYRFAWPFYYVYAAVVAYMFYTLFRKLRQRRKAVSYAFLAGFLVLWGTDAYFFAKTELGNVGKHPVGYSFNGRQDNLNHILRAHGVSPEAFQAILPLPYFSQGSEKIDRGYRSRSLYHAMRLSLQTGLPLATVMMARTSQAQVLAQTQLLGSDLLAKSLLPQLPTQKPFLVAVTNEALVENEEQLRLKGQFLFKTDSLSFYRLPLAALAETRKSVVAAAFQKDSAHLVKAGSFYLNRSAPFVWNGLGWQRAGGVFGVGEKRVEKGPLFLFNGPLPASPDSVWEISVWGNAQSERNLPVLYCSQLDAVGNVLAKTKVDGKDSFEIYGSWVKLALTVSKVAPGQRLNVWLEGKDIWASSFLLKPAGVDVYWSVSPQNLLFNNYQVLCPKSVSE